MEGVVAEAAREATPEETPLLHSDTDCHARLSVLQKAAYGVGHVFNDVCAAIWFSYTLLFLQEVLGMAPVVAGAMLLIGQIIDALATPLVGVLSDRVGSRKLWHLGGTGLVLLSFPLIFSPCPGCHSFTVWLMSLYYAILITVFQTGWAVVQISHLSLIPDLTPSQKGRTELTAIRYTASVCSSVVVYVITWAVFHATAYEGQPKIGPEDAYKFRDIVLICTGLGIVTSLIFHYGLKSAKSNQTQSVYEAKETSNNASISGFLHLKLLQVALLYVASRLFLTISLVYMPLFLNESISDQAEVIASVPLVSYIASFIASLCVKYVNNIWGSKVGYLFGAISSIAGCVWIAFGMGSTFLNHSVYGAAILMGAGSSMTMVTSLCITADLIGTQTENGAFVYSVVTFADKLFNGIAVMIIEELRCPTKSDCPNYYQYVLAFVCGGSALIGVLVLGTMTEPFNSLKCLCNMTQWRNKLNGTVSNGTVARSKMSENREQE